MVGPSPERPGPLISTPSWKRLTLAVAALLCAASAALFWVNGSARGQAPPIDVGVVNGVIQINGKSAWESVRVDQDLEGNPVVTIVTGIVRQLRVGEGCEQVAFSEPGDGTQKYVVECRGAKPVVIFGSPRRDNVRILSGLSLSAHLGGGADKLTSQAPTGVVNGGPGNDTIKVGAGNVQGDPRARGAVLIGGAGTDLLVAGKGHDTCSGGAGNDTIRGGAGNDILNGDAGNDRLLGGRGRDNLNGGPGRDKGNSGPGTDRVRL
jgi:RTX calcium-binding nonapeptide repeat (4 copies)